MPDINIALRKIERALVVMLTHSIAFYGGIWVCSQVMRGLF